MNDERVEAYLEFIQALLTYASGQELSVLESHADLLDLGLVTMMEQVAAVMEQQEDNRSGWLRNFAQQLRQGLEGQATPTTNEGDGNEGQLRAYVEVIEALLTCENGAESAVLQRYGERMDFGLVAVMEQYAAGLQQQGSENNARWLANFAEQLAQALGGTGQATEQDYLNFLMTVLQAEADSNSDLAVVYPILEQHKNLLDERFGQVLQAWATATLEKVSQGEKEFIAGHLQNLAIDIQEFPLGNRADNLEIAIALYEEALLVYTQKDFPQDWAMTKNNLAAAYSDRIREDRAENIEKAIALYEEALLVYTQKDFPQDWAMTKNNLGNAYSDRIREDRAENIEKAINCYREALIIRKPETLPEDCLQTGRNLGNLGFKEGNWTLAALEGYLPAIQAVEKSRNWAQNDDRRQEILKDAIGIYDNAIQCHINLKQYDQAILLCERARSRQLVELMASADLYDRDGIPEEIAEYLSPYRDLQTRINFLLQQNQSRQDKLGRVIN